MARLTALGWTAAAVAFIVAFLAAIDLPLTDPDEALFAAVARQMVESGDWIVPVDRGKPFLDRPILHYWLLAACIKTLGATALSCRLPSVVCGALTVVFAGRIAAVWFGIAALRPTIWAAACMPAIAVVTLAVGHDSSLVALAAAAIWLNLRAVDETNANRRWRWTFAAGIAVGLAVLAKGLLGFALPLFAVLPFAWLRRRWPWTHWLVQFAIAAALGSSWYVALESRVPGSLHYFFIERHVGGYLTTAQRHGGESVWIYLPVLLLGGLPWTALWLRELLATRWRMRNDRRELSRSRTNPERQASIAEELSGLQTGSGAPRLAIGSSRPVIAVWCWLIATIGFFCIAGSKNAAYLLPAFVPLAVLIGGRQTAADALRPNGNKTAPKTRVTPIFWIAFEVLCIGLVRPHLWSERTAERAVAQVVSHAPAGARTWWYFHVPPSARWAEPSLRFSEVNAGDLATLPDTPTILVCRESQRAVAQATPFGQAAAWLPARCRYHVAVYSPAAKPSP